MTRWHRLERNLHKQEDDDVTEIYPDGIHGTIRDGLVADGDTVRTATPGEPNPRESYYSAHIHYLEEGNRSRFDVRECEPTEELVGDRLYAEGTRLFSFAFGEVGEGITDRRAA